jgi:hypothetical protein
LLSPDFPQPVRRQLGLPVTGENAFLIITILGKVHIPDLSLNGFFIIS